MQPTRQPSAEPPRPPVFPRRLALTYKQRVGLPLLVAIPVLTLFGLFGERSATLSASTKSIEMSVRYPTRFRYRQIQPLEITVRNLSPRVIDTVDVSIDTAYITRFSSVRIEPAPRRAFVISLIDMRPGEARLVAGELWGQEYGRHVGRITASTRVDTATVVVRTLVFP